ERDRRAAILTAEGVKQSAILTAEGEKQSAILRAEGQAQAAVLKAEGEARAILQVFDAIHRGDADPKLLAYQYLQMLPEISRTQSNKVWFIPTEFTAALKSISHGFGGGSGEDVPISSRPPGTSPVDASELPSALTDPAEALAEARRESAAATADANRGDAITPSSSRKPPPGPGPDRGDLGGGPQDAPPPPPQP
ncbi:MAG TPA: SPFH domain-containing protein, partial [Actinotalea sp.]|nr:SPFH domain-containing protein [Actinotalea sp.]